MGKNKNIVLSLKLLSSLINSFMDVFVSLYFLQVSNGDLLKLVIYRVVLCTMIPVIFYLTGGICKTNKKIWLLRAGMIFTMAYFITIMLLGHDMPDHYILMGILSNMSGRVPRSLLRG